MTQVALSPVFNDTQFSDNSGMPLAGGKIFTYEAGSNSVLQLTYTTVNGDIEQTNPVILDSSGRLPNEMWLVDGFAYNMVLTLADGTTVLQSVDNVRGSMPVPPGGGLDTVIWNSANELPEYVSWNQFLLLGDFTTQFRVGNRARWQFDDLSYAFGTVTTVTFDGTNTQVTLELDSTGFNNTVINVAWSALVAINMTVDAAGVSFSQVIGYGGNNVGTELQALRLLIGSNNTVWDATGGGGSAFAANPVVASTTYEGGQWKVRFDGAITHGQSTISISGLGGIYLKQYDSAGNQIDAVIAAGMISEVAYDSPSGNMIVLNPLPITPAGAIMFYGAEAVPNGWFICDGTSYYSADHPALFAAIGYTFGGTGDSFLVPNLLGQFVRGWAGSGTVDSGRVFGSHQTGQMESHNHRMVWDWYDGGAGRGLTDPVNPVDITTAGQGGGNASWGVTFAGTGTETRPTNVALLPCIKF